MKFKSKLIALYTIVRKELGRVLRLWVQTLLPSAITTVLYFVIFGHVIGQRVGSMQGYPYIQFIAPGLIMMQIITSSYSGAVSSLFYDKFQKSIEEILVSPMGTSLVLLGYISAGVFRGLFIGIIVSVIALFFTHLHIYSLPIVIASAVLTACVFSTAGVLNALFAKTFDDISIIPTFVLTPLTYLGGVFYSVLLLPHFWRAVSLGNPILYMVSTFRYGFLHLTDSHIWLSFSIMFFLLIALYVWAIYLFKNGEGLRH